jgi:glycosyltransferase involved in cell wall biosynthesis
VSDTITRENSLSELDHAFFQSLQVTSAAELEFLRTSNTSCPIVQGFDTELYGERFRGSRRVGLSFTTHRLAKRVAEEARAYFDVIAAGSEWCRRLLESMALPAVTVPQGIDPLLFNGGRADKLYFRDRFVVFSGGKFEFRKAQDVVLRACKVLQDRHRDVLLVTAWFNFWPQAMRTMVQSPHILFAPRGGDYHSILHDVLGDNGIDLRRVINLSPLSNVHMPQVYQNTDVGLFPNRCEAGTNLVLMEYMACGKAAIATAGTGQGDILTPDNSIRLTRSRELCVTTESEDGPAIWEDPDVDEVVEQLEWAYQNREQLKVIGREAARTLGYFTWEAMADKVLKLTGS